MCYPRWYSCRPRVPFRVVLVQQKTKVKIYLHHKMDVGLALRARLGKRPFRSFSSSAFLVHFVKTKKIETGLLSCLYFLGSPSWTRRSRRRTLLRNVSPHSGRRPCRHTLKTTIQVVFATDSLMLSLAILLPGCSRPTCCIV